MTLKPLIRAFISFIKALLKGSLVLSVIFCFAFQQSGAFGSSQFFTVKDLKTFTASVPGEHTFPFHLPFNFLLVTEESEDTDESEVDEHSKNADNYTAISSYNFIKLTSSSTVSFPLYFHSATLSQSKLPLFVLHHQWKTHLS